MRNDLRKVRKQEGLTIKQLSERSGVSVKHISKLERNETEPKLTMAYRLAFALRRNINDIWGYENHSIDPKDVQ